MAVTRRVFAQGLVGLALSGPAWAGPAPEAPMPAVPNADFDAYVARFRDRAAARIPAPVLEAAFAEVGYLPGVVERDRSQTETRRTVGEYLAIAASDERVQKGRAALARHKAVLGQIERAYGVPPQVLCAIWGMESWYGARMGSVPLISALATLAYDGRRRDFFESQLMAALKILARGDVRARDMTGSWAGAMGHTQFIPTTFLAHAVDFRGDGRRDVWGPDPTDALASAGAYLRAAGWKSGRLWGLEVTVPKGTRDARRSVADWQAMGVVAAQGGKLPDHGTASLLQPAGQGGAAFLLFSNFKVILAYNNAVNYGLGIGHLSDRIAGGGALKGGFPPDAAGLSIADRKRIQTRLKALGYDPGTLDGVVGKATESAIRAYEAANGLPVTGQATVDLLNRLR